MSRNKCYAVFKGRNPGIYNKWFGAEGAEAQIKGFPGAVYKGFYSHGEAISWLKGLNDKDQPNRAIIKKTKINKEDSDTATGTIRKMEDTNLEIGEVIIYTDGGCIKNPGPGGYGVVILQAKNRRELSGGYSRTTNNRMELMACIKGLEALEQKSSVIVYSDSQYVVNGITKGWAKRWQANNWQRNHIDKAENIDLWAQLLELCENHNVKFIWLKGHSGIKENERCDMLSYKMACQNNSPPDDGFERTNSSSE